MIDEIREVQEYLEGKNINKKCLHRVCFLLAMWYKEQGLNNLEIRNEIFNWGNTYHVYFPFSVNSVIYQALEDKHRLRGKTDVYISEEDIWQIISRFDSKNCKLLALAILCYAKINANSDGEVNISTVAFSNWIGLQQSHISGRYIPELIDFDFMERCGSEESYFMWDKKVPLSKNRRYKIKVPLKNEGRYVLCENDIMALAQEVF